MRWGDRSLEAEIIDGRGRKSLSLGDRDEDDLVLASGAKIHLALVDGGLAVRFSTGVAGTGTLAGRAALSLGQLIEAGTIKEGPEGFTLSLAAGDSLSLQVAGQTIEVRQARGRVARLGVDLFATIALVAILVLLTLWVVSTVMGMKPLNLMPK